MFLRFKQCLKLEEDEEWSYGHVNTSDRQYSCETQESDGKTMRVSSALESHNSFPVSAVAIVLDMSPHHDPLFGDAYAGLQEDENQSCWSMMRRTTSRTPTLKFSLGFDDPYGGELKRQSAQPTLPGN